MGNVGDKEIEIQVQIEKNKKLRAFLKKEAEFIGEFRQIDQYYSPKHRDFTKVRPIKEWLRLRDSSGKYSINYKNWYYNKNGRSEYCDEYESPVESLKQLENIFKAIDIKPVTIVDKVRKIYLYKNYEIAIDSIKGLGDFVEVEYKGKPSKESPLEITKGMVEFLKKLDCGKISRNYVGYPFQLMFPKEVKIEEL